MAAAAKKDSEVIPFVKAKPLVNGRMELADQVRTLYCVTVEMGTTVEQIMHEDYWANVGIGLRPGDILEVMPDNMAWELGLRVVGAGNLWAHVVKRYYHKLDTGMKRVKIPSLYSVEFGCTHYKWRVLREGQGELMSGFETEGKARRWAAEHEKALSR